MICVIFEVAKRLSRTSGPSSQPVARVGAPIAIACAALLLSSVGCSRVQTTAQPQGSNPWTIPGVVRYAVDEPDTLNPMLSSLQVSADLAMFWGGHMFNYDDRGQYVPELAVAVPTVHNGGISQDGRTIVYHLRKGVHWQDGAPFGADDIIFSWHAVMNPRNNVTSRVGFDDIRTIDKLDDSTIVVHLFRPYAPFVATFFTWSLPFAVLPKHLLGGLSDINHVSYNSLPIGTGPFRVVDYRHGEDLKLVANPAYWRGPLKLREIHVMFVPDQNTLVSQLRSHEIDLVTNVALARALDVQDIPGTKLYSVPFTHFVYIGFNTSASATRDVRVRRALVMSIDRRRLLANVTHGYSDAADSDQPPFLWAHAGGLPVLPYDPSGAARLLDASGWRKGADGYRYRDGRRLDILLASTAGWATYHEVEQILQAGWRSVGVNTIIKNAPDPVLYAPQADGGILAGGKFDAYVNGWFNGVDPDDSPLFTCDQRPPNGFDYTRFCSAELDAAERLALSSYDPVVRKAAYARVQRILADQVPADFLWFDRRIDVTNTDLRSYRPAHAVTTFWNTWEWSI